MTGRYALVDAGGLVEDVALWDGQAEWSPPQGLTAVEAPAHVGPGWTLDDGQWSAPQAAS